MQNKKIKRIELKIDEAHELEFYQALWMLTQNDTFNETDKQYILNVLKNALEFDKGTFDHLQNEFDESNSGIEAILKEIFDFFEESGKFQSDYYEVSKRDFKEFLSSDFVKEIRQLIILLRIRLHLIGTQNDPEVKMILVALIGLLKALLKGIGSALTKGISTVYQKASLLELLKDQDLKVEITRDMKFRYFEDNKPVELSYEMYVLENDKFIRIEIEPDSDFDESKVIFLKFDNNWCKMKILGNTCLCSYYFMEKPLKKIHDILSLEPDQTLSIPKEKFTELINQNFDGETRSMDMREIIGEIQFDKVQSETVIEYSDLQQNTNNDYGSTNDAGLNDININTFEPILNDYIRARKDGLDNLKFRNTALKSIFDIILKHYPKISYHVKCIITGFISSQVSLLDTKELHSERETTSSYREYLRETVRNALESKISI